MPDLFITFGSAVVPSYTLYLALGAAAGLSWLVIGHRLSYSAAALFDAALGSLLGGVLLARAEHVLLQWHYFGTHAEEIVQINRGGLDWHGALLGGLIGLALVGRWRRLHLSRLLDSLTPVVPLIGLLGWYGCLAWACGYGAEVDTLANYPAFTVSEAPDIYRIIAPRFNTQGFGVALAAAVLLLALILLWRGWLRGVRFWLALALMSVGMFVIGFWRGDSVPVAAGLRLDQWLDLVVLIASICTAIIQRFANQVELN
jgi:phosphatidylglycerol:prolipoprotein diacylglycerol transferase